MRFHQVRYPGTGQEYFGSFLSVEEAEEAVTASPDGHQLLRLVTSTRSSSVLVGVIRVMILLRGRSTTYCDALRVTLQLPGMKNQLHRLSWFELQKIVCLLRHSNILYHFISFYIILFIYIYIYFF